MLGVVEVMDTTLGGTPAPGLNPGDSLPRSRGHLNPTPSAPVHRYPAPADLAEVVRHFWVPEWSLPDGVELTARVLGYPALNLVVEGGGAVLVGPTSHGSARTLAGAGWAVGALLLPAATEALGYDAAALVDRVEVLSAPGLVAEVAAAMHGEADLGRRHEDATGRLAAWLRERLGPVRDPGRLANRAVALVEQDPGLHRVADLAARLHVTTRTLQRAVRRGTGFTPGEVVRRTRLQEAAERLSRDEHATVAEVAHDAGFADHAHLTRTFRDALDRTPSRFRAER